MRARVRGGRRRGAENNSWELWLCGVARALPKPMMARVLSIMEVPTYLVRFHSPFCTRRRDSWPRRNRHLIA